MVENCAVLLVLGTSKILILDGIWLSVLPDYSWQNMILRRTDVLSSELIRDTLIR